VPVTVLNLPEDIHLKLFPPTIKITVMVGLSEYENISSGDFTAAVNYNQVMAENNQLDVSVDIQKPYIRLLKVTPRTLEYLIETE
jgi:hypothetical protein